MKTSELINRLPPSVRTELEKEIKHAGSDNSGLEKALQNQDALSLSASLSSMKAIERITLETIVRKFAYLPFTLEELQASANAAGLSGAEARIGLILLQRRGIIFELRKAWGEALFILPEDMFNGWQAVLFPAPSMQSEPQMSLHSEQNWPGRIILVYDLFRLVSDIYRQSLPLTRRGTVHKKQAQRLAALLELSDEAIQPLGLSYASQDVYGPALALVLDLALSFDLIVHKEWVLQANIEKIQQWIRLPLSDMNMQLYERLWNVAAPQEAWVIHLLRTIEYAESGKWQILEKSFDWLGSCAMMEPLQAATPAFFTEKYLLPLQAMGWLQLDSTTDGRTLFRWRSDFHPQPNVFNGNGMEEESVNPSLYIQSDFDIIAPPNVSLQVLWFLERIAERVSADEVSIYKLSKATLGAAIEVGLTIEDCIAFLTDNARYGVPDHVISAIRDWAAGFERVTFSNVLMMRCRDKETADWLAGIPECQPFLPERIGDTVFIVLRDRFEELILVIDGLGLSPRQYVEYSPAGSTDNKPAKAYDDGVQDAALMKILYEPNGTCLYPVAPRLPLPEEALPGWRTIPAIWWKDCRHYHASTQKEMIHMAMEWKAPLRLRKGDAEWRVVPVKLYESRDGWTLSGICGLEPIVLQAGEWQDIQIMLPEWESLQ